MGADVFEIIAPAGFERFQELSYLGLAIDVDPADRAHAVTHVVGNQV